jgi:F0F1-type ATP synthase assembly protein I
MPKQDDFNLGKFASLGLELGAGTGLGAVIGLWVDRKFHSDPWGLLIGIILGFSSGMYLLIKAAINANKD